PGHRALPVRAHRDHGGEGEGGAEAGGAHDHLREARRPRGAPPRGALRDAARGHPQAVRHHRPLVRRTGGWLHPDPAHRAPAERRAKRRPRGRGRYPARVRLPGVQAGEGARMLALAMGLAVTLAVCAAPAPADSGAARDSAASAPPPRAAVPDSSVGAGADSAAALPRAPRPDYLWVVRTSLLSRESIARVV